MGKIFKSLSLVTKFSLIAFITIFVLGLVSMGVLGHILYYPIAFLFTNYPFIDDWSGDWIWPTLIGVGMLWSWAFIFAGVIWHYLSKIISNSILLIVSYLLILWSWDAFVWLIFIKNNMEPI